jgi:hypothetical protein
VASLWICGIGFDGACSLMSIPESVFHLVQGVSRGFNSDADMIKKANLTFSGRV